MNPQSHSGVGMAFLFKKIQRMLQQKVAKCKSASFLAAIIFKLPSLNKKAASRAA
jgi:hypothetical protein